MKARRDSFTNELIFIIDEALAGTSYVGKAPIGTAASAASWQIMRLVESAGITTITWADGDSAFNNVWNDRASLSYS